MTIDRANPPQYAVATMQAQGSGRLRGRMGAPHLLFTLLAFNGPLIGAVAYQSVVIGYGNGVGAPLAFILAGAILLLFAFGFIAMSKGVKHPGGFYTFVAAGLGKRAGMGAAFVAIAGYYSALIGNFTFFGLSANGLAERFGWWADGPWWLYGLPLLLFCIVLGYFHIDVSAKVLSVLLVAELIVVVVYDAAVVVKGGADGLSVNFVQPDYFMTGSIGIALLFAIMMSSGFEATVVFRDEVKDPERTIPRVTYYFIAGIVLFYSFTAWVTTQALGEGSAQALTAADPSGSVLDAMRTFAGVTLVDVTSVLLITSVIAACLALFNIMSRYVFQLGAEGVLPKMIGTAHPVHHSPHRAALATGAALLVGALTAVFVGIDANLFYAQAAGVLSYGMFFLFIVTDIAVLVFLNRPSMINQFSIWQRVVAPVVGLIGLTVVLFLGLSKITTLLPVSQAAGLAIIGTLYGLFVVGFAVAHVIKLRRPETYARIGNSGIGTADTTSPV